MLPDIDPLQGQVDSRNDHHLPRQARDNIASETTSKRETVSAAALGVDYETAVAVAVELLSFEFPAGAINASSKL